ncbi:MAG TPA: hypothetical protein VFB60_12595 [Ktedonobacteraceae bacterium]|nr:hypothetical protein [Ktedonobacteraceae bacterium]
MILHRRETAQLRRQVEELLANTYHAPVSLARPHRIPDRPNICRFVVRAGPAELGSSLIVKRLPANEMDEAKDASYPSTRYRFFNDWAGLQFLNEVASDTLIVPRFYAARRATPDCPADLLVMEDLKTKKDLGSVLKGKDPRQAEEALLLWAAVLGRLHASTMGKEAKFRDIREAIAPHRPSWGWVPHWQRNHETYEKLVQTLPEEVRQAGFASFHWMRFVLRQAADALSLTISRAAAADLETVIQALYAPGPFLAYTHGDPCPGGNCLMTGNVARLIDFENGDYRHALLDIVYARISFPTCWEAMTLPHSLVLRIEQAYRAELVAACPQSMDDQRFARGLVHACAYWVLLLCQFDAVAQFPTGDRYWEPYKMRQRILARFERFAQTTAEYGYLEALGSLFQTMAATLRERWPAYAQQLPVYPAFEHARADQP